MRITLSYKQNVILKSIIQSRKSVSYALVDTLRGLYKKIDTAQNENTDPLSFTPEYVVWLRNLFTSGFKNITTEDNEKIQRATQLFAADDKLVELDLSDNEIEYITETIKQSPVLSSSPESVRELTDIFTILGVE